MNGLLRLPWQTDHRLLETRLSPEECYARLAPQVASGFAFRTDRPVRGSVSTNGFTLTKTISHRNSFQAQASGRFMPIPSGTRVEIGFALSPIVAVFICLWLGVVGIIFAGSLITGIVMARTLADSLAAVAFAAFPAGMLLFGIGLLAFGRWLTRDEPEFLMRILAETLEAQELPPKQT